MTSELHAAAAEMNEKEQSKMKLKIKKLHEGAMLPKYATAGAACFDLAAVVDDLNSLEVSVMPHSAMAFRTGLSFEVPEGHVMLVFSRSGHGFKNGVRLANCAGVIDSDYRGEVLVKLHNDNYLPLNIYNGDRIAQAMILPVQQVEFEEVSDLSETDRGENGFGSTGVK